MLIRYLFQLLPIFFGLDSSYKEHQLEQIYILVKHLGFSYRDAISIAVPYRQWFIDRFAKEIELKNKSMSNTQDVNNDNISSLKSYEDMINKKFSKDI